MIVCLFVDTLRPHSLYFTVNGSRQAYFCLVGENKIKNKISLLSDVGENGSILTNLNPFIYRPVLKKNPCFLACQRKNKNKSQRAAFFLVGHNFYMSEDSLTVKYTESGLMLKFFDIYHVYSPHTGDNDPKGSCMIK